MPEVGIVCADAKVADVEGVEKVFDEVAGDDREVQQALDRILDASRKFTASAACSTCAAHSATCSKTTPMSAVRS